jgi:lysophospholipase L1-like esterase
LTLACLSVLFALIVAEAFFWIFDPFHYAELEDRERFGREVFLRKGQGLYLKPNTRTSYLGKEVLINSQGMRNPEVSIDKEAGMFRILVVGDSVPFGWGVGQEEAFPRLLETLLEERQAPAGPRYEVINTAVPGWGLHAEYMFLKERGLAYEPDLCLLMLVNNDVPFHELCPGPPSVFFPFALRKIRVARFVEHVLRFFIDDPIPPDYDPLRSFAPEGVEYACIALKRMKEACDNRKVPLVLLDTVGHEEIIRCCEEIDLPRVALDMEPDRAMEYAVAATDTHPNAEGHAWIAERIIEALLEMPPLKDAAAR